MYDECDATINRKAFGVTHTVMIMQLTTCCRPLARLIIRSGRITRSVRSTFTELAAEKAYDARDTVTTRQSRLFHPSLRYL